MESLVVDDADLRHRPLTSLRPARPETGVFFGWRRHLSPPTNRLIGISGGVKQSLSSCAFSLQPPSGCCVVSRIVAILSPLPLAFLRPAMLETGVCACRCLSTY